MGRLVSLVVFVPLAFGAASAGALQLGSWGFDEGAGTFIEDDSGSGNHGALLTGDAAFTPGVRGSAVLFSTGDQRVLVADAASLATPNAITIAAWVRPGRQATQYMVKKARHYNADGFDLSLSGSSGKSFVRFNQASLGDDYKVYSASNYPTDGATWMHLAASFDGATIRYYVNGTLETSQDAPGLVIADNDLPLAIGAQHDGLSPFDGALDDVFVYSRALSHAEIEAAAIGGALADTDGDGIVDPSDAFPNDPAEWNDLDGDAIGDNADEDDDGDGLPDFWELAEGFDPTDPTDADGDADLDGVSNRDEYLAGTDPHDEVAEAAVGIWSMDERTGAAVADSSGLGNHGSLIGRVIRVDGLVDGAIDFHVDRMLVPDDASLDFTDALSISVWLRPNHNQTQYVVKKGRSNEADGYEIGLTSAGYVSFRLNQTSEGNTYKLVSNCPHPADDTTWIHVAAVFDGAEMRLYLDGVLDTSRCAPGLVVGTNDLPLSVGAQDDGSQSYEGAVDELHLFNYAISEPEIETLMQF